MIEIYEVYHFPNISSDIFAGYVDMFVKGEQEASGWPRPAMTEEEKNKVVQILRSAGVRASLGVY